MQPEVGDGCKFLVVEIPVCWVEWLSSIRVQFRVPLTRRLEWIDKIGFGLASDTDSIDDKTKLEMVNDFGTGLR